MAMMGQANNENLSGRQKQGLRHMYVNINCSHRFVRSGIAIDFFLIFKSLRSMKAIVKNIATTNQDIKRIFRILTIHASEGAVVEFEKAPKGSSCIGIINILSREDKNRQNAGKIDKATPIVRYAFYSNVYFPDRLGSVAIYGKDAMALCNQLQDRRTFFGVDIINVCVEYGKRPFVDVRLRV